MHGCADVGMQACMQDCPYVEGMEWCVSRLTGASAGMQAAPPTRGEMDALMRRGPQALPAPRQPAFAERVAAGRRREREPVRCATAKPWSL